jgi:hypothetical protein
LRRPNHRRVHTDDLADRIHQWATRIAGVQRCVGLNDIVDQTTGLRIHRATERADHASCHAGLEAERIPDRNRHLANTQTLGIGQAHMN